MYEVPLSATARVAGKPTGASPIGRDTPITQRHEVGRPDVPPRPTGPWLSVTRNIHIAETRSGCRHLAVQTSDALPDHLVKKLLGDSVLHREVKRLRQISQRSVCPIFSDIQRRPDGRVRRYIPRIRKAVEHRRCRGIVSGHRRGRLEMYLPGTRRRAGRVSTMVRPQCPDPASAWTGA